MSKQPGAKAPTTDVIEYIDGLTGRFDDPKFIAKRLLRKLRAGGSNVEALFARFHPRWAQNSGQPKLADAQLVLARMHGYRSWPELKHHREAMQRCQREIDTGAPAPDHERTTVHVRCGSDIETGLVRAGYTGSFIEFADPLCQGPVPDGSRQTLVETRAGFVSHAYELSLDEGRAKLRRQWAALDAVDRFERVVLWFEHDSYDQLILAAVLSTLAVLEHPCVELICVDAYPGHPKFRGLGELNAVSLRGLWESRRRVVPEDHTLGETVWRGLRSSDPRLLFEIVTSKTPQIPAMAGAVRRHLMELPWTTDGLSLTQRIALETIRAGATTAGAVFRIVTNDVEPLPFLGDDMFWWELRELAAGGAVGLTPTGDRWPQWNLELTPLGEALLRGEADWVRDGGRTRWVGGIACGPGRRSWRWDPAQRCPVFR